jgi:hypothetical protein
MNLRLSSSPKNRAAVEAGITKVNQMAENLILNAYRQIGQASLGYAIRNREWEDYTGNLQDSMGYGIFKNGSLIFWETLDNKQYEWHYGHRVTNVSEFPYGAQAALQVVNNNTDMFSNGYKLLVVAGMGYALNVENIHLHEVLTQATVFTEENWTTYFKPIS